MRVRFRQPKFGAASATDKAASRDNWPLRGAKDSNFDGDVLCFVTADRWSHRVGLSIAKPPRTPATTMGWFSGQSKAAKELERKRQQEKDEENAKKADDVCDEQKTPYQKKVETRRFEV